jgi:hypothetical protein
MVVLIYLYTIALYEYEDFRYVRHNPCPTFAGGAYKRHILTARSSLENRPYLLGENRRDKVNAKRSKGHEPRFAIFGRICNDTHYISIEDLATSRR